MAKAIKKYAKEDIKDSTLANFTGFLYLVPEMLFRIVVYMVNARKLAVACLLVFDKLCILLYKNLTKGEKIHLSRKNISFIGSSWKKTRMKLTWDNLQKWTLPMKLKRFHLQKQNTFVKIHSPGGNLPSGNLIRWEFTQWEQ